VSAGVAKKLVATKTDKRFGHKKGEPQRFINGHNQNRQRGAWKEGRIIDSRGYVLVQVPSHPRATRGGYVYEHILVTEKVLGRPILPTEGAADGVELSGCLNP